jgi:hypothetical protein
MCAAIDIAPRSCARLMTSTIDICSKRSPSRIAVDGGSLGIKQWSDEHIVDVSQRFPSRREAVLYVRVSSKEQEKEGFSIPAGAEDDIAPLAPCLSYVKLLQAAGKDAQLTAYEGAYHGFDNPGRPLARVRVGDSQAKRNSCEFYEQPAGRIMNRQTGLPFSRNDECLKGVGTLGVRCSRACHSHRRRDRSSSASIQASTVHDSNERQRVGRRERPVWDSNSLDSWQLVHGVYVESRERSNGLQRVDVANQHQNSQLIGPRRIGTPCGNWLGVRDDFRNWLVHAA